MWLSLFFPFFIPFFATITGIGIFIKHCPKAACLLIPIPLTGGIKGYCRICLQIVCLCVCVCFSSFRLIRRRCIIICNRRGMKKVVHTNRKQNDLELTNLRKIFYILFIVFTSLCLSVSLSFYSILCFNWIDITYIGKSFDITFDVRWADFLFIFWVYIYFCSVESCHRIW